MFSTFLLALSLSGADLQTLTSPVDQVSEEHPEWEGTLGAGVSLSSGNTGRRSANALMDAELREEERRYTLGFDWQYADESDGGPSELLERRAAPVPRGADLAVGLHGLDLDELAALLAVARDDDGQAQALRREGVLADLVELAHHVDVVAQQLREPALDLLGRPRLGLLAEDALLLLLRGTGGGVFFGGLGGGSGRTSSRSCLKAASRGS